MKRHSRQGMLRLACRVLLLVLIAAPAWAQQETCGENPATSPNHSDNYILGEIEGEEPGSTVPAAMHWNTGLVWKRCAQGRSGADCSGGSDEGRTWNGWMDQFMPKSFQGQGNWWGGATGPTGVDRLRDGTWRMAYRRELEGIVTGCDIHPSINHKVFPNTTSSVFWSGSPNASGTNYAWGFYFSDGNAYEYNFRSEIGRVRLVRAGQWFGPLSDPPDRFAAAGGEVVFEVPALEPSSGEGVSWGGARIEGEGDPRFSLDGGTTWVQQAIVKSGDALRVRMKAGAPYTRRQVRLTVRSGQTTGSSANCANCGEESTAVHSGNTATFSVVALPPLKNVSVHIDNGQASSAPGDAREWLIAVANHSASVVQGVSLSTRDDPQGVLASPTWECVSGCSGSDSGHLDGFALDDLPALGSATLKLSATVGPFHGAFGVSAEIAVPEAFGDINSDDNIASDIDTDSRVIFTDGFEPGGD